MGWFQKNRSATRALWEALEGGDAKAAAAALRAGASPAARRGDVSPLRHALRQESLALLSALLQHGARPDAEAAGAAALWAERADRAQRHGRTGAAVAIMRAKMAISLLETHGAPWDQGIPSLGSGDSARMAINHVFPGCLAPASG